MKICIMNATGDKLKIKRDVFCGSEVYQTWRWDKPHPVRWVRGNFGFLEPDSRVSMSRDVGPCRVN